MKILTTQTAAGDSGVLLSDCGQYRYRLWREWDRSRPGLGFIMLNPSTADHLVCDPTITRCLQRARMARYGRLEVVNLFALRSTNPDVLLKHPAPLEDRPDRNDEAIMDAIECCAMMICAWGAHKAAPARAGEVLRRIRMRGFGALLYHLGVNRNGSPRHPLYVAATILPQPLATTAVPHVA
ncbi:hypothetical protein LMG23992_04338 [Cupriavidus laharis]|uniref:DUF1643 domain-containing protein n=1 Tax=Cupriavidus laharis TaxID=151654 RepID=A0ABM8XLB0_9BURK|nr:DUF1643 domain-containing protein [Cupriavidus laharis]CAG9180909.1 hypothetical protein LMG23992_04338 [Cupriavidus laharis]